MDTGFKIVFFFFLSFHKVVPSHNLLNSLSHVAAAIFSFTKTKILFMATILFMAHYLCSSQTGYQLLQCTRDLLSQGLYASLQLMPETLAHNKFPSFHLIDSIHSGLTSRIIPSQSLFCSKSRPQSFVTSALISLLYPF